MSCIPSYLGRKPINLSEELKEQADLFEVKVKNRFRCGVGTVPNFGTFSIAACSGGWRGSTYGSRKNGFFSRRRPIWVYTEREISFEVVSDQVDTAMVHLGRYTNYLYSKYNRSSIGYRPEIEPKILHELHGKIAINASDLVWDLFLGREFDSQISKHEYLKGWLTDGVRRIKILPILDYQNPGNYNLYDIVLGTEIWLKGFEFVEENRPIGAMQIYAWRNAVWFSKINDPMTNFVLGTTFMAILMYGKLEVHPEYALD
jgi:hypothetical protein